MTESIDTTRASHLERADEALNQVRSEILKSLAAERKNGGSDEVRFRFRLSYKRLNEVEAY